MGLFEKKFCDICGEKVNLLTRQKLEDGFLCSECKHKLSCISTGWDKRTVNDVKIHLEAREKNKEKYAGFTVTAFAGKNKELLADMPNKQFCFGFGKDFSSGNPEIFDFSQLQSFWIEEIVSFDNNDSDGDGIPDNRDTFDNRTIMSGNGMFGGGFSGNIGVMSAPGNIQQYVRRTDNTIGASQMNKYISSVKAHISVKHPYINEVTFYIDSTISKNNGAELMRAYDFAGQIIQLCLEIKNSVNNGFNSQAQFDNQNSFTQQPYQAQQNANNTQQASQPATLAFCPSCGAQNSNGASFCPNCGSSLKK